MASPAQNDPFLTKYGYMKDFGPLLKMVGVPESDWVAINENILVESGGDVTKNETLVVSVSTASPAQRKEFAARGLAIGDPKRLADGKDIFRKATPEEERTHYNRRYANKNGNGTFESGDGFKYRGRGLLQITGRTTYQKLEELTGLPLLEKPELAADPLVGPFVQASYMKYKMNDGTYRAGNHTFKTMGKMLNSGENSDERRAKFTGKNYPAFDFSRRNEFKSDLDPLILGSLQSGMINGLLYQKLRSLNVADPAYPQNREAFIKEMNQYNLDRQTKEAVLKGTKPQGR